MAKIIKIRAERPGDSQTIMNVVKRAYAKVPYQAVEKPPRDAAVIVSLNH
jgi:hypothetical protein